MTQVIYRPSVGPAVTVSGIFDNVYLRMQGPGDEAGVEGRVPTVFLRRAALPTDPMVDEPILTIEGIDYRVEERRPTLNSILLELRKIV